MPTNYTVKQGDTLSNIASQYGVPTSQISGYKSGNPNLIYPGEQLVVPTPEPVQQQPPTQQAVSATGLTGEPQINTNVAEAPEPITSPYTTDIASILEQQKQLVESTQGTNVPTVSTTAEGLGYGTTQTQADALIPEINSLQQQLADLNTQEQKAIGQYINANVSQGFSLGMEGRIKRQYAIEKSAVSANLGVKVALAEMLQGKADKMWSHAQDIVNDLTAKDDANVKDIERFYALNQDTLNYLTDKEKTYLDNIREDAKLVAKNAREDYTNKVSSLMNAAANGLDVSAISGDDISNKSYEDIIAMISNAAQKKLAQERQFELQKTYAKAAETVAATEGAQASESLANYSLVKELLGRDLGGVTGFFSPITGLFPGATQYTKNMLAQVKNILSVQNRSKLKGQGAVSNFEGEMLASASSAINTNLTADDLKKELIKIQGAFANAAGMAANVRVTSRDGKNSKTGALLREDIDDAIRKGYNVEYIE